MLIRRMNRDCYDFGTSFQTATASQGYSHIVSEVQTRGDGRQVGTETGERQ